MKIKICGIRRTDDCTYINEAMPEYGGFIFWPKSFRYVDVAQAINLRRKIDSNIRMAGVFVNEDPLTISAIASSGAIQVVQLHGDESEDFIANLRMMIPERMPIWKAFKIRSEEDMQKAAASSADLVLLDNGYGTGECFDHSLIRDIGRDYILAGGLTVDNIPDVMEKYHPFMIDISSGVETDKMKDREKILKAVELVRS